MIFRELYTLPNSTAGIDAIVTQTLTAVPGFVPLLLVFIFFTVFLGGVGRQSLKSLSPDYPAWAVIASLVTFMSTLILSTATGFIRLDWLVIATVATIFSGVWFFLDRKPSEL